MSLMLILTGQVPYVRDQASKTSVRKFICKEMDTPVIHHRKLNKEIIYPHTCTRGRSRIIRQKIEEILATGERFSIFDIMEKIGAGESTAYRHINEIISDGEAIRKKQSGKFYYWKPSL